MIEQALHALRPGARWNINGGSLAGIEWVDQEQARPTDAEITAKIEEIRLPLIKAGLSRRVDDDAERERLRYITPGAGMAMTYQEKKDQAVAVIAMGEAAANALPNNGAQEFPTLSASVPVEASSLYAAAQVVIARYEAWAAISRGIELARMNGKKSISDASDAAAAQAAYEAITWPNP